jgi:hypothetical protein
MLSTGNMNRSESVNSCASLSLTHSNSDALMTIAPLLDMCLASILDIALFNSDGKSLLLHQITSARLVAACTFNASAQVPTMSATMKLSRMSARALSSKGAACSKPSIHPKNASCRSSLSSTPTADIMLKFSVPLRVCANRESRMLTESHGCDSYFDLFFELVLMEK